RCTLACRATLPRTFDSDLVGDDDRPRRSLRPFHDPLNTGVRVRRCVCRALCRGSRGSGSRNGPRSSSRVGRRRGRILNPKTARSQIIGGVAGGIGMALLEETVSDRTGRLATTSLAEYVVASNADIRDIDVLFVGQPDSMTAVGSKGVGELALT